MLFDKSLMLVLNIIQYLLTIYRSRFSSGQFLRCRALVMKDLAGDGREMRAAVIGKAAYSQRLTHQYRVLLHLLLRPLPTVFSFSSLFKSYLCLHVSPTSPFLHSSSYLPLAFKQKKVLLTENLSGMNIQTASRDHVAGYAKADAFWANYRVT